MKFNTIIHLPKIAFLALLTALLIACGDTTTAPNPDISNHSLTYNNIAVPQNTASSVSVSPNWSVTPTEVSYSISPNLPSGAILNPTTGVISGTINISAGTTTYTVTATGSGANTGTTTATFTITAAAPVDLSSALFTYEDINVHVNSPASTSPMWTNYDNRYDFSVIYQVSPSLPAGLSIDTNSGIISGSSTAPVPTSSYTVTATGTGFYTGSTTTTLNITVAGAGQTFLNTLSLNYSNIGVSYSNGVEVYTINITTTPNPTIANISPQWSNPGGAVNPSNITYAITPPLPVWVNFDTITGVINNTSAPSAYYRQHTVTATGSGNYVGTKDATVIIAIAQTAQGNQDLPTLVNGQITAQGNYANLNIIDTSLITDMQFLFSGKANFNGDISRWDVSGVTDMLAMFDGASSFNGDISQWNISNVTDMSSMFDGASSFNGDISQWNVSNVTDMSSMFSGASSFNGDISQWNVSNVINMLAMFSGASSFNQDISKWNVGNVNDMDHMFSEASSFNQDISTWNVSNVNNMRFMFNGASSFNQDISTWNVNNVNNMDEMFHNATVFAADLEVWNISNNVNTRDMFTGSDVNIPLWYRNLNNYVTIPYLTTVGYDVGNQGPIWDIPLAGNNFRNVTYTISPDISGIGLILNATSGVISGTISTTNITNIYTVTAKPTAHPQNFGKTATVSFSVSNINISPLTLNYGNIFTRTNQPVTSSPVWSYTNNDYPLTATYTVTPALPAGLTLNATNGTISGTPTARQSSTTYTITAIGNDAYVGNNSATFTILLAGASDVFLSSLNFSYSNIGITYSNGVEVYTFNISNNANPTIPTLTPQWSDGSGAVSPSNTIYSVDPSLPTWLGINSNTGEITQNGSPTPYYLQHTITATGSGGYVGTTATTTTIAIAVNAMDNANLKTIVDNQLAIQGNTANLNIIDTSRVTDMNSFFERKTTFNGDVSRWDVSSVTNMRSMFQSARSFNGNLSNWDVSSVVDMYGIFNSAQSFNGNLSDWDVSNVIDMREMFAFADNFNGDLSRWNVSSVIDMSSMFARATSFNGNLSSWDVSKVTRMATMFEGATAFQGTGLRNWGNKLANINLMIWMFKDATAFTEDLESWVVPSNATITGMFDNSGVENNKPSWCTADPSRGC